MKSLEKFIASGEFIPAVLEATKLAFHSDSYYLILLSDSYELRRERPHFPLVPAERELALEYPLAVLTVPALDVYEVDEFPEDEWGSWALSQKDELAQELRDEFHWMTCAERHANAGEFTPTALKERGDIRDVSPLLRAVKRGVVPGRQVGGRHWLIDTVSGGAYAKWLASVANHPRHKGVIKNQSVFLITW